jgi:hypothetical protein
MITDTKFDEKTLFDKLVELKDDEEKFNDLAKSIIDKHIAKYPPEQQRRMRQIQWRLDGELSHYKNPTTRYNKMVELFWKQVNKFYLAHKGITDENARELLNSPPKNGVILELKKKKDTE